MIPRGGEAYSGTAMWTPTARRQHRRDDLYYENDLSDAKWALIEPFMPEPRERGRPWAWPLREILNASFMSCAAGSLVCNMAGTGLFETLNHCSSWPTGSGLGARPHPDRQS